MSDQDERERFLMAMAAIHALTPEERWELMEEMREAGLLEESQVHVPQQSRVITGDPDVRFAKRITPVGDDPYAWRA